jgi:hypothetical protein
MESRLDVNSSSFSGDQPRPPHVQQVRSRRLSRIAPMDIPAEICVFTTDNGLLWHGTADDFGEVLALSVSALEEHSDVPLNPGAFRLFFRDGTATGDGPIEPEQQQLVLKSVKGLSM